MNIPINIFIKHLINNNKTDKEFSKIILENLYNFIISNDMSLDYIVNKLQNSNLFNDDFKYMIKVEYKSLQNKINNEQNSFNEFINFHKMIYDNPAIPNDSDIECSAFDDVPYSNLIRDENDNIVDLLSWKEYYTNYLCRWNSLNTYEKATYMIANWKLCNKPILKSNKKIKLSKEAIEKQKKEEYEHITKYYSEKWFELNDDEKSIWSKPKNLNPYTNWISIYKNIVLEKYPQLENIELYKCMGRIWSNIKDNICYTELYKCDTSSLPYIKYSKNDIDSSHDHNLSILSDYLKAN